MHTDFGIHTFMIYALAELTGQSIWMLNCLAFRHKLHPFYSFFTQYVENVSFNHLHVRPVYDVRGMI